MNQGAPPPAGGFGGQPHGGAGPIAPPNAPRGGAAAAATGTSIVLVVILIVVGVLVVGGGIMAVLAIYGTRKYIANAKTAEAKNSLGQIAKDAVVAYEGEAVGETPQGVHAICRSASQPVPMNASDVSGKKYQSTMREWRVDQNSPHTGFACLRFEMTAPQYYQYDYRATAADFTGRARGDLNGDGTFSTFEIRGQLQGDKLLVAPSILETSPEE